MKLIDKIIGLSSVALLLHVLPGYAEELDIFKSNQAFSLDIMHLPNRIPNLESIPPESIEQVLRQYLKVSMKLRSREKKNLLNLAISYLYFKKGDYSRALNYLKNNIIGNFILDDFKINLHAMTLKELALQELEKKKLGKAIDYLRKSITLRLIIYKSFPDSYYYSSLPGDLAKTEKLLGDAFYLNQNYKAAWQAYRKALMRSFPDNELHQLHVYLSLAKTYESANNLQEAVDIFLYLSNNFKNPKVKEAALVFINKHEKTIREKKMGIQNLISAYSDQKMDEKIKIKSNLPRKNIFLEAFENGEIEKFYEFFQQRDYNGSFKQAQFVLKNFPGTKFTKKIVKDVNRMIIKYLKDNSWNTDIERIIEFYPAQTLRALAYDLWRNHNTVGAAILYNKILSKYPLEIESCHKALYFLGRIFEDKKEYVKAVRFYDRLLNQYDFGPFTTSALFKIPWIERLQDRNKEAIKHFKSNIKFYESTQYDHLLASFPESPSFLTTTRYWLGQTLGKEKRYREKKTHLKKLFEESPFSFYAFIAHEELGMRLKDYFIKEPQQPISERVVGLGETQHKHLKRAEKLITIGLMNSGLKELLLAKDSTRGSLPFIFYLSRLFYLAGDYHKSIQLSWRVFNQDNNKFFSIDLMKNLFPTAYLGLVESFKKKPKVDPMLILSLIRQESGFDSKIVSSANAIGLMQLLPSTAKQVAGWVKMKAPDYESLKIPKINLPLGIDYLDRLLTSFDHKIFLALAAYNAGPQKVKEWIAFRSGLTPLEFIESIPYNETRNYVKKVLRNYYVYQTLYKEKEINSFKELLNINRH